MMIAAITPAPRCAAAAMWSAAGIKLALTLLTDTDRTLSGSGAPAAPLPAYPAVQTVPGRDFPALIAARFVVPPRKPRAGRPDQPRKRD